MGRELTVGRIEKVGRIYVLSCESGDTTVVIKVKKLNGAREGDVISFDGGRIEVLEELTRKRREHILALQNEMFGKKES